MVGLTAFFTPILDIREVEAVEVAPKEAGLSKLSLGEALGVLDGLPPLVEGNAGGARVGAAVAAILE
jgi:hypothetical protein